MVYEVAILLKVIGNIICSASSLLSRIRYSQQHSYNRKEIWVILLIPWEEAKPTLEKEKVLQAMTSIIYVAIE